jgi:photosystem II S4 domain protein
MLDSEKLLSHLHREEEQILGGKIIDKIELVLKRKKEQFTDFLNPYQQKISAGIIKQIYEVNYLHDGGYEEAERKRICLFPEYLFPDHINILNSILKIEGNFKFQSLSHRDFLGALMGLGIKRKKLGDLLVLDDFAQVVVTDNLKEFISLKLKKVHEVPVKVTEIKEDELIIPSQTTKEIKATVASMRLDAVASAGFGDSRNKISRKIKNKKVKLNWKPEIDPAQEVEINDLISIRSRGRVEVVEKRGISNRGRIKLLLKRYT